MKETKSTIRRIVTIPNNTKQSTVIDKSHYKNMVIIIPAEWDAADMTFLVSDNPTNGFVKLMIADNNVAATEALIKTPAASMAIAPAGNLKIALENAMFIKLRSGVHGAEVAQTPGREFTIILSR